MIEYGRYTVAETPPGSPDPDELARRIQLAIGCTVELYRQECPRLRLADVLQAVEVLARWSEAAIVEVTAEEADDG